jgi:hypothetical protein
MGDSTNGEAIDKTNKKHRIHEIEKKIPNKNRHKRNIKKHKSSN